MTRFMLAFAMWISVLAPTAFAQELNLQGISRLPTALLCGPQSPTTDQRILDEYGEIPFLEGDGEIIAVNPNLAYPGTIRFFLDPDDFSYSIFLDLGEQFTCLVVTGNRIEPVTQGDDI